MHRYSSYDPVMRLNKHVKELHQLCTSYNANMQIMTIYRYTHTTALYYCLIAVRPVYATYTVVSKERTTSSDDTEESFVFDS